MSWTRIEKRIDPESGANEYFVAGTNTQLHFVSDDLTKCRLQDGVIQELPLEFHIRTVTPHINGIPYITQTREWFVSFNEQEHLIEGIEILLNI